MKKLKVLFALVCLNLVNLNVFSQQLDWVTSIGEASYDEGNSIAVDASGNVYTTGIFSGTSDFDPGSGTFNLTATGGSADCFISKLDASGNLVWARQIAGAGLERGIEIVVDASGNVYVTGGLWGSADFDPGAGTFNLTSSGASGYDIFVFKLDASGNFVWAKLMGGDGFDEGLSIAVDASGNVYTTGRFTTTTTDFDPGPGTFNLFSWGGNDIFISKLDVSGNFVWAKNIGGSDYDQGDGIAVDVSGNIYVTGSFMVGADFDPGAGACVFNALGPSDIFVLKLDPSGNFMWAKQIGGTGNSDHGFSICTDNSGNVYTSGYFGGTVDFDPNIGTTNLVSLGSVDAFVLKLDASGNFSWAKNIAAGGNTENAYDIAVDASGNVYTTGYFGATTDFDPGPGTFNMTSVGGPDDIFISKLDASGNFSWAKQMGGASNDQGFSIAVDVVGNILVSGNFIGTVDFDPGSGTTSLVSAGSYDVFILKLNSCNSASQTENITACAPYTWKNGVTYITPQTGVVYTAAGTVPGGCDSVYTLNLTILNTTSSTDVVTACDSYTWMDGVNYTASNNTATYVLTNTAGCDSTITLNLTITNANSGIDVVNACDSYTWIDGVTYTTSNNTATHLLTNASGCDSIVTLNLTINNAPNMTANDNGFATLTASAASSYQWIDCSTNLAMSGETGVTFTAWLNGTYAVIGYSTELCADTSDCIVIDYLSTDELNDFELTIVPNPASDFVTITFNETSATLIIRDVQGKPVYTKIIQSNEQISLDDLSNGMYFFELTTEGMRTIRRVLKS